MKKLYSNLKSHAESIRNIVKQPWMSEEDFNELKTVLDAEGYSVKSICSQLRTANTEIEFERKKHFLMIDLLKIIET